MSDYFDIPRKYDTMPYAKAGVTPGWDVCKVFNRDTGDQITDVIECNPREGWLIKNQRNRDGSFIMDQDGHAIEVKIKGYFEIRIYRKKA